MPLAAVESRFDDTVLPLVDPHGLKLALVEPSRHPRTEWTPWDESPVPPDHQIRGLYGAQIWERDLTPSTSFLTRVLGMTRLGDAHGWVRYAFDGASGVLDLQERPLDRPGAWGVGSVHHLAWRVDDEAHQQRVRAAVLEAGGAPTPVIDRFWFKSVYFREPGGVLFELATDGPGFAVDEDPAHLGEMLVLPPFLESQRAEIERVLPVLRMPDAAPGTAR